MVEPSKRAKRNGRQRKWVTPGRMVLLSILLVGVMLLPRLVANTPLLDYVIARWVGERQLSIQIAEREVGWFRPIRLTGVRIGTRQEPDTLHLHRVETTQPLWQVLWGGGDGDQIQITGGRVALVQGAESNSLQRLLNALGDASSGPSTGKRKLTIRGTTLEWSWGDSSRSGETVAVLIEEGDIWVDQAGVRSEVQARVVSSEPSHLSIDFERQPSQAWGGQIKLEGLDLESVKPLLVRLTSQMPATGKLDAKLSISGGASELTCRIEQLNLRDARVDLSQWLPDRTVEFHQLGMHGVVRYLGDQIRVENLDLQSDLGRVQCHGSMDLRAVTASWSQALVDTLLQPPTRISGDLNLQRVAQAFPRTLRLHEDLAVQAGRLQFSYEAKPAEEGTSWQGRGELQGLTAQRGQRVLKWERPVQAEVRLAQDSEGYNLEQLQIHSEFVSASIQGSSRQGQCVATGKLSQLWQQISQFVNVGSTQLGGDFQFETRWQQQDRQLGLNSQLKLTDFVGTFPGRGIWSEPALVARLTSTGARDFHTLDTMQFSLAARGDQLGIELTRPLNTPSILATWPLKVQLVGELGRWQQRAKSLGVDIPGTWTGNIQWNSDLRLSDTLIVAQNVDTSVTNLAASVADFNLEESRVELKTYVKWDRVRQELQIRDTRLRSASVGLASNQLLAKLDQPGLGLQGDLHWRANLRRIAHWSPRFRQAPIQAVGEVVGHADFQREADQVNLAWDLSANPLSLSIQTQPEAAPNSIWQDAQLATAGQAIFDAQGCSLQRLTFTTSEPVAKLELAGRVQAPYSDPQLQLAGKLIFDPEQLGVVLQPWLGSHLKLTGEESFRLQGHLRSGVQDVLALTEATPAEAESSKTRLASARNPQPYQFDSSLSWEHLQWLGLEGGAGTTRLSLRRGELAIDPWTMTMNEGTLALSPALDLHRRVFQLSEASLDQLTLSPDLCRGWLKYVAPLLADTARAEGKLSFSGQQIQYPWTQPQTARGEAVLRIHQGHVGPGDQVRQLLTILDQVKAIATQRSATRLSSATWIRLPEQSVQLSLREGRVHHDQLRMIADDVMFTSSGSVGLDQTLSLTISFPIQEDWIKNSPLRKSLQGRTVSIPVRGTMDKPKLDERALRQLGGETLKKAAGQLLEQQLQDGLKKLFGGGVPLP